MKNISIICASPPHFNLGMHSVDLAFFRFVKRHELSGNFSFYCLPDVNFDVYKLSDLPFKYKNSYENISQIAKSDVIVFWGDFLHSRVYLNEIFPRIKEEFPQQLTEELLDIVYKTFLLENIDLKGIDLIIFGGNLMNLDSFSFNDARYISNLLNLYKSSSLILMRDIHSAMAVNHLIGNYEENFCGVDCAFLLNEDKAAALYSMSLAKRRSELKIGIFFGRSWYYDACFQFSLKVCKALDEKGVWIPWFHQKPWPLVEKYSVDIDLSIQDAGFKETLALLQDCSIVISDTYHFCINAWSLGVPAICIGRGVGSMKYSTDDKKKEILYSMIGASNLYVYAESILASNFEIEVVLSYSKEPDIIKSICKTLQSKSEMDKIFERIDAATSSAEKRLLKVLSDKLH